MKQQGDAYQAWRDRKPQLHPVLVHTIHTDRGESFVAWAEGCTCRMGCGWDGPCGCDCHVPDTPTHRHGSCVYWPGGCPEAIL